MGNYHVCKERIIYFFKLSTQKKYKQDVHGIHVKRNPRESSLHVDCDTVFIKPELSFLRVQFFGIKFYRFSSKAIHSIPRYVLYMQLSFCKIKQQIAKQYYVAQNLHTQKKISLLYVHYFAYCRPFYLFDLYTRSTVVGDFFV